jgi:uncharacterized DUF497 family protein
MARAGEVFAGATITVADERKDYGEPQFITPRGSANRIISMRKANVREQAAYGPRL